MEKQKKVAIIGAGPAGLAAGIYLQRANIKALLFDGDAPGGKMVKTAHIENYPGFKKINGADLAFNMFDQTMSLGAELVGYFVKKITQNSDYFTITTSNDKTYDVDAVIICNGTENRKLNIPGENEFFNKGVSYCAICDSSFFRGEEIAVAGSGNTAGEESVYLSNIGKRIHLFVRGDKLKCDQKIIDELNALNNVIIYYNSRILEILGNGKVQKIKYINDQTNEEKIINVAAVFPFIGLDAIKVEVQANFQLERDEKGFLKVDELMRTNIPGIYGVGDIVQKKYRQITTAVADGTIAALNSIEYMKNKNWK